MVGVTRRGGEGGDSEKGGQCEEYTDVIYNDTCK